MRLKNLRLVLLPGEKQHNHKLILSTVLMVPKHDFLTSTLTLTGLTNQKHFLRFVDITVGIQLQDGSSIM